MSNAAHIAAQIMEHLCNCSEHGYSQPGRQGTSGTCAVATDAGTCYVTRGDRDCSSAVIDAWKHALALCGIAEKLDGATYTGNMRSVFLGTGLFTWEPMSFTAQRGDIYLNEVYHTAMCLDDGCGSYGYDALGEFSISENGTIDGEPGDQTGHESSIHAYYDYPWNGILHFIGGDPQPASKTRYRVRTREYGWHDWMEGLRDTGGSDDDFAGSEGCEIYGFECEGHEYRIVRCDGTESINSQGNEDSPICGIEVSGDVTYRVHWLGDSPDWGKWEHGADDNGAGKDENSPIDMVQMR